MTGNSESQEGTTPQANVYNPESRLISLPLGAMGKPPATAKSNNYSILLERDSPGLEWHPSSVRMMRPASRRRIRLRPYAQAGQSGRHDARDAFVQVSGENDR